MEAVNQSMKVIGLMSGTSLDGLDIAYVSFHKSNGIEFKLICSEMIPYSIEWKQKLSKAFHLSQQELIQLDSEYGIWLGNAVLRFIKEFQIKPDLIASHGHTIFHKPDEKYTLQIGSGKVIRSLTHIPVINNFRVQDVALGGQGAPLVPIGDEWLFPEYDFCLNLGGFSNISWKQNNERLACDIGPCNILLNEICKRINVDYDKDGKLAEAGTSVANLLDKWNAVDFYKITAPKSLGREWYESNFQFDIQLESFDVKDLLATSVDHITFQINQFINSVIKKQTPDISRKKIKILLTGGGAHNSYMIKKLRKLGVDKLEYIIPENDMINFKEAIVFALLGYLRWNNEINVLASVTGAIRDHSSGDIHN